MDSAFFLNALEGRWILDRLVSNGTIMDGLATFTQTGSGKLRYFEEGRILNNGNAFMRSYDYVAEDSDLSIFYADGPDAGKLFLKFEKLLKPGFPFVGKADHLCMKDHYAGEIGFVSDKSFSTRYDVTGPEKDYTITTNYTKL